MSLSTCEHCGGNIPLGPEASNCCEGCGAHVFSRPAITPTIPQRLAAAREWVEDERVLWLENLEIAQACSWPDHEEAAKWSLVWVESLLALIDAQGPVIVGMTADALDAAEAFGLPFEDHESYRRAQSLMSSLEAAVQSLVEGGN